MAYANKACHRGMLIVESRSTSWVMDRPNTTAVAVLSLLSLSLSTSLRVIGILFKKHYIKSHALDKIKALVDPELFHALLTWVAEEGSCRSVKLGEVAPCCAGEDPEVPQGGPRERATAGESRTFGQGGPCVLVMLVPTMPGYQRRVLERQIDRTSSKPNK
eukprot:1426234-Amphidinium_carterae.1